jgi:hypothetical protein
MAGKTPYPEPKLTDSTKKRFWSKVAITANENKCWNWIAGTCPKGYGKIYIVIEKGIERTYKASRISYLINFGVYPGELLVCHTCDNPLCVNPKHLFLGTEKDNAQDRKKKNRQHDQNGEKNGSAILTEDKVKEIRRLYSIGVYQRKIGKLFGIGQYHVSRIVTNKIWNNIN